MGHWFGQVFNALKEPGSGSSGVVSRQRLSERQHSGFQNVKAGGGGLVYHASMVPGVPARRIALSGAHQSADPRGRERTPPSWVAL